MLLGLFVYSLQRVEIGDLLAELALYIWFKNREQLLELLVGQSYLLSAPMDYLEVKHGQFILKFFYVWVLMAQVFVVPIVTQSDEIQDCGLPNFLPKRLEFGTRSSRVRCVVVPLSRYLSSLLRGEFLFAVVYLGLFGRSLHSF